MRTSLSAYNPGRLCALPSSDASVRACSPNAALFFFRGIPAKKYWRIYGIAKVAELVDAPDLGSDAARRGGSSPPFAPMPCGRVGSGRRPVRQSVVPVGNADCAHAAGSGRRYRRNYKARRLSRHPSTRIFHLVPTLCAVGGRSQHASIDRIDRQSGTPPDLHPCRRSAWRRTSVAVCASLREPRASRGSAPARCRPRSSSSVLASRYVPKRWKACCVRPSIRRCASIRCAWPATRASTRARPISTSSPPSKWCRISATST